MEVVETLLGRCADVDSKGNDGRTPLSWAAESGCAVRITQQHLANMLGATRERVNRQLQAFAEQGIIALERGQVRILDRAGLEEAGAAEI